MSTPVPREKALFIEALEIEDPKQRSEFLDQACGADVALREEVQNGLGFGSYSLTRVPGAVFRRAEMNFIFLE
jgi:hypothetical protein